LFSVQSSPLFFIKFISIEAVYASKNGFDNFKKRLVYEKTLVQYQWMDVKVQRMCI
jgi:hypothetical protein